MGKFTMETARDALARGVFDNLYVNTEKGARRITSIVTKNGKQYKIRVFPEKSSRRTIFTADRNFPVYNSPTVCEKSLDILK